MKFQRLRSLGVLILLVTLLGSAIIVLAAAVQYVAQDGHLETGLATITETDLREDLRIIAHKNMQGRGSMDNGCELPSFFLGRELRKYGFEPLGDDETYFQKFNFGNASQNVLGYLEGKDKNGLVVIGAHYDHVGLGETGRREGRRGEIFYGADDNGSGTVALLELAEAFSELAKQGIKPNRSILVCFWGAEEWGELGSQYFLQHLPQGVELNNVAAYINMDMVGRNDPKEIFVFCAPVADDATEAKEGDCKDLYEIVESVNKKLKLEFKISHRDITEGREGFQRTDGWTFYQADRGNQGKIPTIELFTGEHPDYHTPRDTYDKINYPKLTRVAKLAFGLAWQVSQMNGRPAYR